MILVMRILNVFISTVMILVKRTFKWLVLNFILRKTRAFHDTQTAIVHKLHRMGTGRFIGRG